LRAGSTVPRSSPNQILSPSALRGPSQIRSIASASPAVRQLVGGAVGAPQRLAVALNVQVLGSSMMPSVTPSAASHAATADAVVWLSLAAEIGPPARSFIAICPPHLRGLEPGPVDRRCARQDAVELAGQLLGEQVALAPAGRAAVPVIEGGPHAVVRVRHPLREQHLLLDRVADEVLD